MIKTCYVCNKQFDAKPSNKKICDACRDRISRCRTSSQAGSMHGMRQEIQAIQAD